VVFDIFICNRLQFLKRSLIFIDRFGPITRLKTPTTANQLTKLKSNPMKQILRMYPRMKKCPDFFRCSFVLLMLILTSSAVYAQNETVNGKITDETGTGMPGVNIVLKGTTQGTTSDVNGDYSIKTSGDDVVLVFTFIGYRTQEISANGKTVIDVSMAPDVESLTEVVVVGYGIQKKSDLTGAVASVPLDNLKEAPNTNIAQFLQGTVPGLNVGVATSSGGTPPISIRGRVSLNGNQNVLIILDGIQYGGSLSSINPDDIASIDVLKDASSTAVYGAQAANGVIILTSKKGKAGERPTISFNTSFTTQTPTVGDFVPKNREQYLEGIRDAFYTQAFTEESGYTEPNPDFNVALFVDASMRDADNNLLPNDYNWWDAGTKTGTIFENNLSISGGNDHVNYLLSGGFVNQKGFIINDEFKRNSLRANIEIKPVSWWTVGLIASGSFVNQDGAEPSLATLQRASPLHVPRNAAGDLIISPTNTLELNAFLTYDVDDYDRHNYYFANVFTEVNFPFLKGLSYRLNFGNNLRTDKHYYASKYDGGQTGRAYKDDQGYYDYTLDNIITYKKEFNKHEIGLTLLYGAIERKFSSTFTEGTGFSRLNLSYNDLSLATTQRANSDAWEEALLYQMARVNYKYNERYLLTATLRRDGFSGFAKNHKYGLFPTLALAWVMSEENFIKDNISQIDQLKLRLGYGEIGNQTSRYSSLSRLTTLNGSLNGVDYYTAYVFGDGGTSAFGQRVNTLGNDDLKWERTKGLNIGLDFSLFNDKTSGTLDFYNNNTYDLLFDVNIPNISGFNMISTNLGQIHNVGFEASITQRLLTKANFSWSTTVNYSTNKNEIVTLTGQDLDNDGVEDDLVSSNLFIGKSIGAIYHYQTNGVYDLDDTRLPGFPIGSMSVVDQDGDGDITPEKDRVFLGRTEPAYRISLMNNFSYKGFNLSFLINAVQGGRDGFMGVNRPYANNIPQYYREDNTIRWNDFVGIDYWSPRNPDGKYPRNISGTRAKVEPNMYQDRSFVRLQDVSLSYNLTNVFKKLNARSLNVFVSAKNLFTWTKWEGWDPEAIDTSVNPPAPVGIVAGGRPVLRAFAIGASITY
jgi:TonB-dependent starch-binding outer membrane protein SusC